MSDHLPPEAQLSSFASGPRITDQDFERFRRLIYASCGIRLSPHKKVMVEARLRKRLRHLRLETFEQYRDYLFGSGGMEQELIHLIDVITTNKTDFFREAAHFEFLQDRVLPELQEQFGCGVARELRVWSAGCSSGEEPYTLAMLLSEFGKNRPGWRFSILASDISTKVLKAAELGVYDLSRIDPVPEVWRRRYFLRSRDRDKNLVRVVPELRARVSFKRLNFMDDSYPIGGPVDILFCRNVIIYFDRPTQERLLHKLCRHVPAGRYIFMGHSETLSGMGLPLTQVSPSVYRRH